MANYIQKLLLSLGCIAFSLCQGKLIGMKPSCECGARIKSPGETILRIVNGTVANPDSHPWLVSIYIGKNDPFPSCGGVLISNLHVLTAAHCIKKYGMYGISHVILGQHDISRKSKTLKMSVLPVEQWDPVHEGFNDGTESDGRKKSVKFPINDIALLELQQPITSAMSDLYQIQPICLPDPNLQTDHSPEDPKSPYKANVIGWGLTSYGGKQSNVPLEAKLDIVPNGDCQFMFSMKSGFVEPQHMCAYTPGKDACLGDSGGPLFAPRSSRYADEIERQEVLGLVSFGDKCGTPGKPAGFTRVSAYIDWIIGRFRASSRNVLVCNYTFGKWVKEMANATKS